MIILCFRMVFKYWNRRGKKLEQLTNTQMDLLEDFLTTQGKKVQEKSLEEKLKRAQNVTLLMLIMGVIYTVIILGIVLWLTIYFME